MSYRSSSLTNDALDRLFGYNNNSTDNSVFMQQIPSNSSNISSQLTKLFGGQDEQLQNLTLTDPLFSMSDSTLDKPFVEPEELQQNVFSSKQLALPEESRQNVFSSKQLVLPEESQQNLSSNKQLVLSEESKQNVLASIPSIDAVSKSIVYHIVIDSAFTLDLKAIKPYTHGRIRAFNREANRIPVTLDLSDAERIANKVAIEISKRGSSSSNAYPVLGVVILQIELDNSESSNANIYQDHAKRDYGLLREHMKNSNHLVTYNAGGVTRGMLHQDALQNASLTHIKYVAPFKTDEHMGFAMFNMLKLNYKAIYQLKQAYTAGLTGNLHKINVENFEKKPYTVVKNPQSTIDQKGGVQIDYKQLYLEEKATYLKLKALKNKKN